MAAKTFDKALKIVLAYEGGYSNHPSDPGGPTNKGVIQRVYDGYRRGKGQPTRSVKQITNAELRDIYRRQYWELAQADRLPAGVDLVVFDAAVNSGPSQAAKWLQRALRVRVDGDTGEATIAAANAHPDHDALCAEICRRRLGMLQSLKTYPVFGRGWSRRVGNVVAIGQAWAAGSVGPAPLDVADEGGNAKASLADVNLPPAPEEAGVNTGAAGGGLAAIVQGARESLENLTGSSETIAYVFAALTVLGVALALGGGVYWWWAKRRRKAAERAFTGEAIADLDPLTEGMAA